VGAWRKIPWFLGERIRPAVLSTALSLHLPFKEVNPGELFMGIKPSYIKNLGTALLARQKEYFSKNFDENKQQLEKSAVINSKRVRNRVAGYITRKMNSRKQP
jgi:small subunit ribosomal protein S17e